MNTPLFYSNEVRNCRFGKRDLDFTKNTTQLDQLSSRSMRLEYYEHLLNW